MQITMPTPTLLGLGMLYEDVILTVPSFPAEDSKLRATSRSTRIGGNLLNTFSVLASAPSRPNRIFCGAVGSRDSCRWISSALAAQAITPLLQYREDSTGPASAYILCSAATGSRTIVSHNALRDPDTVELESALAGVNPQPDWIHVEGRNFQHARQFLIRMKNQGRPAVSVDLERERPGLREFVPVADVLFVSQSYAKESVAAPGEDEFEGEDARNLCRTWIRKWADVIKPTAVVYVLLGKEGCCVIWKREHYHDLQQGEKDEFKGWQLYYVLPTRRLLDEEVVESVGAGDTFIAGVLWAWLSRRGPFAAAVVGNHVARMKCCQTGFDGLWKDWVVSDSATSDLAPAIQENRPVASALSLRNVEEHDSFHASEASHLAFRRSTSMP